MAQGEQKASKYTQEYTWYFSMIKKRNFNCLRDNKLAGR